MLIRDALKEKGSQVFRIGHDASILDAVRKMNEEGIGSLVVTDEKGNVAGIITERDILKSMEKSKLSDNLTGIMTPAKKMLIVTDSDTVDYAMKIFTENRIRHLPVYSGDSPVGMLSIGDAVKYNLSEEQSENKFLHDYISGTLY